MRFNLPGYQFLVTGRSLHGCLYGGGNLMRDIPVYIDLVRSGALDIASLVTRSLPLDDIQQGFTDMVSGVAVRSVVAIAA
jgi:Zn-dependent alcohol dehydrogenase